MTRAIETAIGAFGGGKWQNGDNKKPLMIEQAAQHVRATSWMMYFFLQCLASDLGKNPSTVFWNNSALLEQEAHSTERNARGMAHLDLHCKCRRGLLLMMLCHPQIVHHLSHGRWAAFVNAFCSLSWFSKGAWDVRSRIGLTARQVKKLTAHYSNQMHEQSIGGRRIRHQERRLIEMLTGLQRASWLASLR